MQYVVLGKVQQALVNGFVVRGARAWVDREPAAAPLCLLLIARRTQPRETDDLSTEIYLLLLLFIKTSQV
jgi:hypothetical protein